MPPLPISRSAVDRLGKRLAASDEPSDDDLLVLLEVLAAYQQALDEVQGRMSALGHQPTTRTKTTSVLVDKMRRERSSLKSVQDIAGARIVCEDLAEQDDIVTALVAEFADGDRPCRVKDRRAEPSYGYRAVHVIVHAQGLPVEIQVRTRLQDVWAQIVESLGDRWGRGIRYGEPLPEPGQSLGGEGTELTRLDLWKAVGFLAERVEVVERGQADANRLLDQVEDLVARVDDDPEVLTLKQEIADLKATRNEDENKLNEQLELLARIAVTV